MDSQINALLTNLLNQETPYSLQTLKTIFTPHTLWLNALTPENIAEDPVKRLLHSVYQHTNQWDTALNALATKPQEPPTTLSKEEKKPLQKTIKELQRDYQTKQDQIQPLFSSLLDAYNEARKIRDHSVAHISSCDNLDDQIRCVEEYRELLTSEAHGMVSNIARLALYHNEKQRQTIHTQLQETTGRRFTDLNTTAFAAQKDAIIQQMTEIRAIQKTFNALHDQWTQYLSIENKLLEIQSLIAQQQQGAARLAAIETQLETITLDETTRQSLHTQFDETVDMDKNKWLETLQTELDYKRSRLSLTAWIEWATQATFNQELATQQIKLNFLRLLQERHHIHQAHEDIEHILCEKKTQLISLNYSEGVACPPEIPADITPYLLNLPSDTPSDTTAYATALLETLLTQAQGKTTELQTLEQTLAALNAIESLEKAALDIRVKTPSAKVPDDAEAIHLQTTIEAQQEAQCAVKEQIQLCQTCHESLRQLKNQVAILHEKETLLAAHSKKKSLATRPTPQTSREIALIQTTITALVIDFKEKMTQESQRIQPVNTATQALQTALTDWDVLINHDLNQHAVSTEITAWYHTLFKQLQAQVNEEAPLLQAIQLLHAIHFELQHAKQSDCVALKTYYTQYPNPQESYLQLLQLKPPLPLVESQESLFKVNNKKMQNTLDRLYQHQKQLQKKHPKAGILLKQATITLHQFALAQEKDPSHTQAADLTFYLNDPYYRCLNNHRGFGKFREWLAEVCTAILNGLHITRNTDHRQRFFYSPTHSIQLLNSAAPELGQELVR